MTFETITESQLLSTETVCGKTRLSEETGKSFLDGKDFTFTVMVRCEREPEHDGPHYGPIVKTDGWEQWDG